MRKVTDLKELERRVEVLESRRETQIEELKTSFHEVAHQLSPAVLIRKGIHEVVSTPGLKSTAIDTAVGSGLGFIGRKIITGRSNNIFRKLAGMAVQFIVSNLVRNKLPKKRLANSEEPGIPHPLVTSQKA